MGPLCRTFANSRDTYSSMHASQRQADIGLEKRYLLLSYPAWLLPYGSCLHTVLWEADLDMLFCIYYCQ